MKNTVSKGFLYYIFVLLGVVVGVACIFGGILIFSPGTELFGIIYINEELDSDYIVYDQHNENSAKIGDLIANNTIRTLEFNTDYVDVSVFSADITNVTLNVSARVSGFTAAGSITKFNISSELKEDEGLYTFNCFGPQCDLKFSDNAKVTLLIPFNFDFSSTTLSVKTQTGIVTLGRNLNDRYILKDLIINSSESSIITLGDNFEVSNHLEINSKSGTIDFYTEDRNGNPTISPNTLRIDTDNAKIDIKALKIDGDSGIEPFKLISESSSIKIGKLEGPLYYDADKGVIIIDQITKSFTCSERVNISNIEINKALGDVLLPKANTSNITVNELYGDCGITSSSGTVKIKKMYGRATIETVSGDIEITLAQKDVSHYDTVTKLTSEKGDITVNFGNIINTNEVYTKTGDIKCAFDRNLSFTCNYESGETPKIDSGIISGEPNLMGSFNRGTTPKGTLNITTEEGLLSISDKFELA